MEAIERELAKAGTELILHPARSDLIVEIFGHNPDIVRKWYSDLIGLGERALCRLHNVALIVAQVIACENQSGAVALFENLSSCDPILRVTIGVGLVSLEALSVWKASDGDEIRRLRFKRLDQAQTDHDLAMEVLAAINSGKELPLRDYVLERRARPEPANVARAIIVAGFSNDTSWAIETIDAHKNDLGYLGEAYNAAKFAMDRLLWSKHWAKLMCNATTGTDLWRFMILLTTIADGRLDITDIRNDSNTDLMKRFAPTFDDIIGSRIDKWGDKRKRTLFGMTLPDPAFLT